MSAGGDGDGVLARDGRGDGGAVLHRGAWPARKAKKTGMLWCWSDIVLWKIVQGELIAVSASAQLSVLPHLAGHHQHRTNLGVWGYDSVCMRGTDTRVGCSWFDIGHGNRGERYFQSRVADSKLGDHSCERCGCCVWLVFPATKFSMLPLLAK